MHAKAMDKLTAHYEKYFQQQTHIVLHPLAGEPHIDVLVFEPNEAYPFWKLATMGASDYVLPNAPKEAMGNRNEYMMFIHRDENLKDTETSKWYAAQLTEAALSPILSQYFLGYGHSLEWTPEGDTDMAGAFIEMPQAIQDVGILRCKLGLLKTAVCLQVVLLTKPEIDLLLKEGAEWFSNYLYPENEGEKRHFLSERRRTERF